MRALLLLTPIIGVLMACTTTSQQSPSAVFQNQTLGSGLELVTYPSSKVPLVTIVLASKAGAMTEQPGTDGLTHLWEHMFFKGNATLPDQEAFQKRVRQLGMNYNGDTSAEKVRYYFTLPSAFLEEGLKFMFDAIHSPKLEEVELAKERLVVVDEYDRAASRPSFDLGRLTRRIIYGDKDYLRDPLGQRPLILKADRPTLLRIKDEVFVPANSALLISGDFDPATIRAQVEKAFADWKTPANYSPPQPPPFPPFPQDTDVVMVRDNTQNVLITRTFQGPRARIETEDTYAADLLITLLGMQTGKFYRDYRESGLALSASLGYYTQSQAGEVSLYGYGLAHKGAELMDAMRTEPQKWLAPDYFTQQQLETAKRTLRVERLYEINSPSDYIKNLAFWWAITGMDYYRSYLDNLLATDLDDVRAFIRKYLIDKPAVTTVFLNSEDAKIMGIKDNSQELMRKHFAGGSH